MKCRFSGCPGCVEHRRIVHAVRHRGEILVFEDVPAEVCDVCGDTLLAPETVRHLEEILKRGAEPRGDAPVFPYV